MWEASDPHALYQAATGIGPTNIYGVIFHEMKVAVYWLWRNYRTLNFRPTYSEFDRYVDIYLVM